jgi:hypothetical protein
MSPEWECKKCNCFSGCEFVLEQDEFDRGCEYRMKCIEDNDLPCNALRPECKYYPEETSVSHFDCPAPVVCPLNFNCSPKLDKLGDCLMRGDSYVCREC